MKRKCCNCLWGDNCQFEMPCDYYMPLDYEFKLDALRLEERGEERVRGEFADDWQEYMAYCAEEYN